MEQGAFWEDAANSYVPIQKLEVWTQFILRVVSLCEVSLPRNQLLIHCIETDLHQSVVQFSTLFLATFPKKICDMSQLLKMEFESIV